MLQILFYFIWGINIICSIKKKSYKIVNIITFIFIIVLFAGNTYNGDYNAYVSAYTYNYRIEEFEYGFQIFMQICRILGLTYNQFLLVLALIGYGLIYNVLLKYSKSISVFVSLYFAILIFYDINQIRNFLGVAILFFACAKLQENKKIAYIILIVSAKY